jgi:hypothetical protein
MLKRLAILAVLLSVAQAGFPVPGKTANPETSPGAQETQRTRSPQPSALFAMAFPQSRDGETFENDTNKESGKDGWDKAAVLADYLLVIVGIAGISAALRTLRKLERQTKAAEDAAQSALLNAQALINSERPWLMVTVEEFVAHVGGFQVYVTNKGRTPAMIAGAYMGCAAAKVVSALPAEAPYGPGTTVQDRIILPDEKLMLTWFSGVSLQKMIGEGFPKAPWEGQTFVFGKVVYRDLLSPPTAPSHETRWIGLYQLPTGESGDLIFSIQGIGIPAEYDSYT